jgi:hypothetical protein
MDARFFASLFEGDSDEGVKLGMGLTGGDFWPRPAGCRNLYVCDECDMDFDELVCVTDIETRQMFATVNGLAGAAYYYALREVNGCGDEQRGEGAVVRVAFGDDGELVGMLCNDVLSAEARQVAGRKVKLVWYYCRLGQGAECAEFRIYGNGGSGQVDFGNAIATVKRTSASVYAWVSEVLGAGRYRFCVRCVMRDGEEVGGGEITAEVTEDAPEGVGEVKAKAV